MSMKKINPIHQHRANPSSLPKFMSLAFVLLHTSAFIFPIVQCKIKLYTRSELSTAEVPQDCPRVGSAETQHLGNSPQLSMPTSNQATRK